MRFTQYQKWGQWWAVLYTGWYTEMLQVAFLVVV